jgi:hypothetical protein
MQLCDSKSEKGRRPKWASCNRGEAAVEGRQGVRPLQEKWTGSKFGDAANTNNCISRLIKKRTGLGSGSQPGVAIRGVGTNHSAQSGLLGDISKNTSGHSAAYGMGLPQAGAAPLRLGTRTP